MIELDLTVCRGSYEAIHSARGYGMGCILLFVGDAAFFLRLFRSTLITQ